jgi:hypothetical protein
MATAARRIRFHHFGSEDPLQSLGGSGSAQYIRRYLNDLGCKIVVEEPVYFDRDYLAEFSAFYSKSTRGYLNSCRRLHFFSDPRVDRTKLKRAAGGSARVVADLQQSYLGFAVVRPFDPPLLGRTVLCWYPDDPSRPGHRVTAPSREYAVHISGVRLTVRGLAWQSQDTAVGACATVALWSMLHSSAFDDHHAIPTTAAITMDAHKTASLGSRVFPSSGLTPYQLCEAIKAQKLSPVVVDGDLQVPLEGRRFSSERFLSTCAAFVRSGYPVLMIGKLEGHGIHAVCATGFRDPASPLVATTGETRLHDADIEFVYVHDDNLGPGVRSKVGVGARGEVRLKPVAPPVRNNGGAYLDPSAEYPDFSPSAMVVAVHEDLVVTPDKLHTIGLAIADGFSSWIASRVPADEPWAGILLRTRFMDLREYMTSEVARHGLTGPLLGRVRLELTEVAEPMSLHLGLVQLSWFGQTMLHVIFDTTDNERYLRAFAHIVFNPPFSKLTPAVGEAIGINLGVGINAF